MWILLVIVVTGSDINVAPVDRYATEEDCNVKKDQYIQEFTAAYPGDRDWAFACVLPNQKQAGR